MYKRQEDIRFGLGAVRNVGEDVVESIIQSRNDKGQFSDFSDYLDKIEALAASKRVTESLIKAGAFDSLGHPRKGLVMVHEDAVDAVISTKKAAAKGQFDLFAGLEEDVDAGDVFRVEVPDQNWEKKHQLALERDMLGLYVSGHPLDGFEDALDSQIDTPLPSILSGELPNNKEVKIGGIISSVERRVDRNGNPWVITTVEDQHGAQVELVIWANTYQMVAPQVVEDNIILAKAKVRYRDDRMSVVCDDLKSAELSIGAGKGIPLRLRIRVDQTSPDNMLQLRHVLEENQGESDVYLTVVDGEQEDVYLLSSDLRANVSPSLMGDLKASTWEGILG